MGIATFFSDLIAEFKTLYFAYSFPSDNFLEGGIGSDPRRLSCWSFTLRASSDCSSCMSAQLASTWTVLPIGSNRMDTDADPHSCFCAVQPTSENGLPSNKFG